MKRLKFSFVTLAGLLLASAFGVVACSEVGPGTEDDQTPAPCPTGYTTCNGTCSNAQSDPLNCGTCGNACGAGLVCSLSACSATCATGLSQCGAACENVLTSPSNCGTCGNACASGVCENGVCAAGQLGSGGGAGTGGAGAGTGGAGVGTGGSGSGGTPGGGDGLLGGYHVSGDWSGFAFAFASGTATAAPLNYEDLVNVDGPYCIKGTVPNTTDYSAIAAVGVHVNQDKADDAEIKTLVPQGDALAIDITVNNSNPGNIRIQIEAPVPPGGDPADYRWCANGGRKGDKVSDPIPWAAFNRECWEDVRDETLNYAMQPINKIIAYYPDEGPMGAPIAYDFCLNDIGPGSVVSRGTGQVVANCGNNVTWDKTTLSGTQDASANNNLYRAQANFWNSAAGGNFTMSLLPGTGFKMDTQTCNTTTDSPCSFPSVYIGVDGDGGRSAGNGLPKVVDTITSIPTCLGWNSGGTPASHEYNVAYDVWFSGNAQATEAEEFLMVWFRDPPSFQAAGKIVQNGVVVGDQTWTLWHGPNHQNRPTTSFIAPLGLADGMAYQFDLMDFINEAAARGYITKSKHLISVMGGLEIWGGAQGASITSFKTEIK